MVYLVSVRKCVLKERIIVLISDIQKVIEEWIKVRILKFLTTDKCPVIFGESGRKQQWESGQHIPRLRTSTQRHLLLRNEILKAS